MIKLFRKIRQRLLAERKVTRYLAYAAGEIILVVIGILLALQINNWNQQRKERIQEMEILKSILFDLRADMAEIKFDMNFDNEMIGDYSAALDILSGKKEGTKEDLSKYFRTILQVGGVSVNTTTFNNLQTTGEIRIIKNKAIADSIVMYYNTKYMDWATALRDYTRNITAPYFLEFDYLPPNEAKVWGDEIIPMPGHPDDYVQPPKSLEEYQNNIFIINTLRQKIWNLRGIVNSYEHMLNDAENLGRSIQRYLD